MPEPSQPRRPKDAAGTGTRLAWLDVLRGLAALAVVFDHLSYYVLQHVRAIVYQWFDPGNYGVFVFFIISGYIVPASLERKGSVRTFWVSRLFRLYPLYLLAVGIAVALYLVHFGSLRGEGSDPETSILSQLLMMSNVLAGQQPAQRGLVAVLRDGLLPAAHRLVHRPGAQAQQLVRAGLRGRRRRHRRPAAAGLLHPQRGHARA